MKNRVVIDIRNGRASIVECSDDINVVILKENEDVIFDSVDKSSYLPIQLISDEGCTS